jgi:hypothetical protein
MAMYADAVSNPAIVRKIRGSISRIDIRLSTETILRDLVEAEKILYFALTPISARKDFSFCQNNSLVTMHETYNSLLRLLSDSLLARLLLSLRTLSDSSFFSDDLFFHRGEAR